MFLLANRDANPKPTRFAPRGTIQLEQLELAREATCGDRAALRSILEDVGPSMANAARSVLGSEERLAEDVVQESLLAFVDALSTYRGECGLKHFACRIAAWKALQARRKTVRRREKLRTILREEVPNRPETPTPMNIVASEQRKELLRCLLDELPSPQAEALTLRAILGHSLNDIATLTSAPVNTVRSRLRLAKEALRQRIEGDPEASELFGRTS